MKKIIIIIIAALMLVAGAVVGCKYLNAQVVDGPGMVNEVDSLETDSVPLADDGKHTVDYIRQRVDGIYACYKNPKYDEAGLRLMKQRAEEMAGDDDIVLDYDHWTNSQDDNNFTYEVGRIDQITDSTAFVEIYGKNFGNDYTIVLGLYFERGDWYVDDFLSPDRKDGEKEYFRGYIRDRLKEKGEEVNLSNYAE